jgi:KDO2-lipid IV(A) lauroyltransferase
MSRVTGKPVDSGAVKSLVRKVFRSYGLYYADFFGLNGRRRGDMTSMVRIEGIENLKAALKRGKGAIFVTAHIGSWDMGGAALAATEGLPELSAVVEPVATRTSDFAVTEMREKRGIKVIPLGKPMSIGRALRRNEIVFVLAERLVGAEGVDVEFFGEKAPLPKGAAYWALKCGAPIVPGFCIRQSDGTYIGHIERPIDPEPSEDFEADIRTHTQRVADVVERYIARYPEQWCMLQRVWRTA